MVVGAIGIVRPYTRAGTDRYQRGRPGRGAGQRSTHPPTPTRLDSLCSLASPSGCKIHEAGSDRSRRQLPKDGAAHATGMLAPYGTLSPAAALLIALLVPLPFDPSKTFPA